MNNNKRLKIYISISLFSVTLILLFLVTYIPLNFQIPENTIIKEYNSEKSFFSDDRESKLEGGFDFYKNYYSKYKFQISNWNILKPKYSLVLESPSTIKSNDQPLTYIQLIELERVNFIGWKVVNTQRAVLRLPFNETLEIAKKYDLSKENPNPDKITVYPPLTAEQIEANKKAKAQREAYENSDEYKQAQEIEARLKAKIEKLNDFNKKEYDKIVSGGGSGFESYEALDKWLDERLAQQGK